MNDEKQKYANGSSIDASEMSKEEKIQAIEYWCEGNQQLKKLLLHFNEKDVETIGCCSGHEKNGEHTEDENAYVAIKLGTKMDKYIIDLLTALEAENKEMQIGFVRGQMDKSFCVLCAKEFGNNEKFFEGINEECMQLSQNKPLVPEIRKRYDMLRIMLIDERAQKYGSSSQYRFYIGDEKIDAVGFFKYGRKLINIPNSEIERMGECFINNPGNEMPIDFYGKEIEEEKCSIKDLKKIAQSSKQPLSLIKRAFEIIRNVISDKKETNKVLEESGR